MGAAVFCVLGEAGNVESRENEKDREEIFFPKGRKLINYKNNGKIFIN